MKAKFILVTAALALLAAAAAICLWPGSPPQIITFSDGVQYRFTGATWGTNHSQPGILAHIVDHLPAKWADYTRKKLDPRFGLVPPWHTADQTPRLVVWFQPIGSNLTKSVIVAALRDENGVSSGSNVFTTYFSPKVGAWQFDIVPRRSRTLECDLVEPPFLADANSPNMTRIKFRNPAFGRFPQWHPESLPDVKTNGDVMISLDTFSIPNVPLSSIGGRTLAFSASTGWLEVENSELSDATGNRIADRFHGFNSDASGPVSSAGQLDNHSYYISGALWPVESAWRLKLGLKRTSDFPAGELVTISNFPVLRGQTSPSRWSAGSVSVTNYATGRPVIIRDSGNGPVMYVVGPSFIFLNVPDLPADFAADVVGVSTDSGMQLSRNPLGNDGWILLDLPQDAKFLTITVAIQKLHFVEFLVKPPDF